MTGDTLFFKIVKLMTPLELQALLRSRFAISLRIEWVEECLRHLRAKHANEISGWSEEKLVQATFSLFLLCDLNQCGQGVLPPGVQVTTLAMHSPMVLEQKSNLYRPCTASKSLASWSFKWTRSPTWQHLPRRGELRHVGNSLPRKDTFNLVCTHQVHERLGQRLEDAQAAHD